MTRRRRSLGERREATRLAKRPRTREVPHPFLLPNLHHQEK